MKTVTVKDVIDAVRANGLPQAFGSWYYKEGGKLTGSMKSACAATQAAINLGLMTRRSVNILPASNLVGTFVDLTGIHIPSLNDSKRMSCEQIADYLDKRLSEEVKRLTFNVTPLTKTR